MNKLLRAGVLFALIGGLMAVVDMPVAPAQVKKDAKTQPKDDGGTVEVYTDKKGEWRYRVKNPAGKSIAIGTDGFEKKEDVLKIVEQVKSILNKSKVVEIKTEKK